MRRFSERVIRSHVRLNPTRTTRIKWNFLRIFASQHTCHCSHTHFWNSIGLKWKRVNTCCFWISIFVMRTLRGQPFDSYVLSPTDATKFSRSSANLGRVSEWEINWERRSSFFTLERLAAKLDTLTTRPPFRMSGRNSWVTRRVP